MDAKTTHDYFLGPSSLGPIMQLLVLLCQYQFVIKKPCFDILGAYILLNKFVRFRRNICPEIAQLDLYNDMYVCQLVRINAHHRLVY